MRAMRVRLRIVGAVCFAGGIVARIAFAVWTQPSSRAEMSWQAYFLIPWFGIGLVLLAVPLFRRGYTSDDSSDKALRRDLVECLRRSALFSA